MGGMMGGGGGKMGGGGGGGGGGKMPSTSAFDMAALGDAANQSAEAVHNRYSQLGIGVPGAGQSAAQAAAGGTSLTAGGPSTMELQDIGAGMTDPGWGVPGIPSEQGGIAKMLAANIGQLQTQEQSNPALAPTAGLQQAFNTQSTLGSIANQQQGQAGVAAGLQAGTQAG